MNLKANDWVFLTFNFVRKKKQKPGFEYERKQKSGKPKIGDSHQLVDNKY